MSTQQNKNYIFPIMICALISHSVLTKFMLPDANLIL